jgi:hypothetical protein
MRALAPLAGHQERTSGSALTKVRFAQCPVPSTTGHRADRRGCSPDAESDFAGDGDLQGSADLTHPLVAESAEALDERPQRHALDRVEVDDPGPWNGVLARLEQHLTRDTTDPCRAGPDQRAKARNRQSRESTTTGRRPTPGKLTPPDLSSRRKRRHDASAAVRNEARSPHSGPGRTRRPHPSCSPRRSHPGASRLRRR